MGVGVCAEGWGASFKPGAPIPLFSGLAARTSPQGEILRSNVNPGWASTAKSLVESAPSVFLQKAPTTIEVSGRSGLDIVVLEHADGSIHFEHGERSIFIAGETMLAQ